MAQFIRRWLDGSEIFEQYVEDGRLFTVHRSLNEAAIMRENATVRANGGPRNLSFGRPLVQLSEAQYALVTKLNPDLVAPDGKTQKEAWRRLAAKFPALSLKG